MEVKYLTKEQFQRLNNRAIKRNANRTVKRKFIELLTDGLKFPIIETFLHNVGWTLPCPTLMCCLQLILPSFRKELYYGTYGRNDGVCRASPLAWPR